MTQRTKKTPVRKPRSSRRKQHYRRDKDGFLRIGQTVICCRNGGTPMSHFGVRS